ncbi:MAG: hypothetical protein ACK58N_16335 [Synechocystis sp.]
MPTFSCPQCGAAFTASHKPSACSQCGSRQMRTNRNGAPASGNLSPPKLRRSPISEPTAMTALNSSSVSEAKTVYWHISEREPKAIRVQPACTL